MGHRNFLFPALPLLLLSGCLGDDYATRTNVYVDGSVERTIVMKGPDSTALFARNIFAANEKNGWLTVLEEVPAFPGDTTQTGRQYTVTLTKWFPSANAANDNDMSSGAQFRIQSAYKDDFWWFYSDIEYSDTYLATIHFDRVKPGDFFTEDDYAFMDRTRISEKLTKEDSIMKAKLDARMEAYLARGLFEEIYDILKEKILKENAAGDLMPKIDDKKEWLFQAFLAKDFDTDYLQTLVADSLHVPVKFSSEDKARMEGLDEKHFFALFDRFSHIIEMPQDITASNADSLAGNRAYWFKQGNLVKDFTMTATSRKINYLAVIATIFIVAAVIFIFLARKSVLISRE